MIGLTKHFSSLESFRESYQGSLLFVISARNESRVKEIIEPNDELIVVKGEPTLSDIVLSPKAYRSDGIVGLGGGSVIDWAKLIYVLQNKINFDFGRNGLIRMNRTPRKGDLIAIPTLLGSGAEWSSSCPLVENNRKIYLSHPHLAPSVVHVKGLCLENYNSDLFRNQIADIFSHLFESQFSRKISEFDQSLCNSLLKTMREIIERKEEFEFNNLILFNHIASLAQDKFLVGPAHALAHTYYSHFGHTKAVAIAMYVVYTKKEYSKFLASIGFTTEFFQIHWLNYFGINTSEIIEEIDWNIVKNDLCMTFSKLK